MVLALGFWSIDFDYFENQIVAVWCQHLLIFTVGFDRGMAVGCQPLIMVATGIIAIGFDRDVAVGCQPLVLISAIDRLRSRYGSRMPALSFDLCHRQASIDCGSTMPAFLISA